MLRKTGIRTPIHFLEFHYSYLTRPIPPEQFLFVRRSKKYHSDSSDFRASVRSASLTKKCPAEAGLSASGEENQSIVKPPLREGLLRKPEPRPGAHHRKTKKHLLAPADAWPQGQVARTESAGALSFPLFLFPGVSGALTGPTICRTLSIVIPFASAIRFNVHPLKRKATNFSRRRRHFFMFCACVMAYSKHGIKSCASDK